MLDQATIEDQAIILTTQLVQRGMLDIQQTPAMVRMLREIITQAQEQCGQIELAYHDQLARYRRLIEQYQGAMHAEQQQRLELEMALAQLKHDLLSTVHAEQQQRLAAEAALAQLKDDFLRVFNSEQQQRLAAEAALATLKHDLLSALYTAQQQCTSAEKTLAQLKQDFLRIFNSEQQQRMAAEAALARLKHDFFLLRLN